jgi:hypothetical protein
LAASTEISDGSLLHLSSGRYVAMMIPSADGRPD